MESARRSFFGCLGILIAMIVCGSTVFLAIDRVCYAGLSARMPVYPGAVQTFEYHNMLTSQGMGETVMLFTSPDAPDVVQAWYARTSGEWLRAAAQSKDLLVTAQRTLTRADFAVTADESGTGSLISLIGECAN